jgi:hypothetical protein
MIPNLISFINQEELTELKSSERMVFILRCFEIY